MSLQWLYAFRPRHDILLQCNPNLLGGRCHNDGIPAQSRARS